MPDVGHNMLHLYVAQQLQITLQAPCVSPSNDNDSELNRQFPFGIDPNKMLQHLLKLITKGEKPGIEFSQHTSVHGSKAQSSGKHKLCYRLIFS